ncbi:MAG TPA: penicillin-binding protein activator [Arenimonas sp.]|nr:penicillin-binding protein activator [Arenimonas sp.]
MHRVLLAVLLLALTACATVATLPVSAIESPTAERLLREGQFREAAMAWTTQAEDSRGGAREFARLQAADAWLRAGDAAAAQAALDQVRRRRLGDDAALQHDLINAELQLLAGRADAAMPLLMQPRESIRSDWRPRWHRLRAQLFVMRSDNFSAAAERAYLGELDRSDRAAHQREIERLLAKLGNEAIAARTAELPAGHPLYPYAGRSLSQRGLPLPRPYQRSAADLGETVPPADRDGYRPPQRIAALLPLSGPLAAAGNSVRDGLLAGYFGEARRRPELRFFDTARGLDAALAAAREWSAQLLVGPLERDEVTALFERNDSALPMLALNRGSSPPPPGSASFALAPEDDGIAAADRLAERGLLRVLAITQGDDNAQRALLAFRERLQQRGGEVIGEVKLDENNPDYLPALQAALAGGTPQALFLSLKAAPARLLAAQLELVQLAELPRVATSLILSGSNPRMDGELDGIQFPDLPWLHGLRSTLPEPEGLGRRLPTAQGAGARLFAFGLDAWRLAAYLEHLGSHPDASVLGATGELRIDGFGQVYRAPEWAVFAGGRPRPALDGLLLPDSGGHD